MHILEEIHIVNIKYMIKTYNKTKAYNTYYQKYDHHYIQDLNLKTKAMFMKSAK